MNIPKKFKSKEEMAVFIQNLPLNELRKIFEENSIFLFKNDGRYPIDKEEEEEEEDEELIRQDETIQNMSLEELRNLPTTKIHINKPSLEEKSAITGLDKQVITKLEKQKEKATLQDIMIYCRKLGIAFKDFLPELYG